MKKDNVIIADSATVWDNMEKQITEMKDKLRAMEKLDSERDRIAFLKSIEFEGVKSLNRELNQTIEKQDAIISISKDWIIDRLEMTESMFDSDEAVWGYADLKKYSEMADYAEKRWGRKQNEGIRRRVRERLNKMPF